MKTLNLTKSSRQSYHKIYNQGYWVHYPISNILGARIEDQWPAICYAHGLVNIPNLYNVHDQISFIKNNKLRSLHRVIEIGSGQGEVSCLLHQLDYSVQTVDVNNSCEQLHRDLYYHWFNKIPDDSYILLQGDLDSTANDLDLNVDAIFFVESIEHIHRDEWLRFFTRALPYFKRNNTLMVITNLKGFWPLIPDGTDHVMLIDENFYDELASYCQQVLYRDNCHIALQF